MSLLNELEFIPIKIVDKPILLKEVERKKMPLTISCCKPHKPEAEGLFCERIFGKLKENKKE